MRRLWVAWAGDREVALFTVRIAPGQAGEPGGDAHVVLAGGMGVGVVGAAECAQIREAMGGRGSAEQARWRSKLEGVRVAGVGPWGVGLIVEGGLWVAASGGAAALTLGEQAMPASGADDEASLGRGAAAIVDAVVGGVQRSRRETLARALKRATAKLERRMEALRGDLARVEATEREAEQARLFVAQAAQAKRGATRLEATDWSTGEERVVEMKLDPARTAKEQVDAVFKRARRLRQGAHVAGSRMADAQAARDALVAIAKDIATQEDAELARLEARAREAAPREFRLDPTEARRGTQQGLRRRDVRLPYRTFLGASGVRILAGRGAADNDALTCRVARPHDLWLHAKSRTGAHVVVVLDKGATCTPEALVEAAHLAAHFSEAREERIVEVEYTPRRYVRKPRGSAPGLVVVEREKVIVLRRDDEILRRLLQREVLEDTAPTRT